MVITKNNVCFTTIGVRSTYNLYNFNTRNWLVLQFTNHDEVL